MNERGAELLPAHTCIITPIEDTTRVLLDFFVSGRLDWDWNWIGINRVKLELCWNKLNFGNGL
jgi:hypothetical protein